MTRMPCGVELPESQRSLHLGDCHRCRDAARAARSGAPGGADPSDANAIGFARSLYGMCEHARDLGCRPGVLGGILLGAAIEQCVAGDQPWEKFAGTVRVGWAHETGRRRGLGAPAAVPPLPLVEPQGPQLAELEALSRALVPVVGQGRVVGHVAGILTALGADAQFTEEELVGLVRAGCAKQRQHVPRKDMLS